MPTTDLQIIMTFLHVFFVLGVAIILLVIVHFLGIVWKIVCKKDVVSPEDNDIAMLELQLQNEVAVL